MRLRMLTLYIYSSRTEVTTYFADEMLQQSRSKATFLICNHIKKKISDGLSDLHTFIIHILYFYLYF